MDVTPSLNALQSLEAKDMFRSKGCRVYERNKSECMGDCCDNCHDTCHGCQGLRGTVADDETVDDYASVSLAPCANSKAYVLHQCVFWSASRPILRRIACCSARGQLDGVVPIFFEAIKIQAEDNLKKAQAILTLYEEMKKGFHSWPILNLLFGPWIGYLSSQYSIVLHSLCLRKYQSQRRTEFSLFWKKKAYSRSWNLVVVDVRRSWFSQDFLVLLRGRRLFDIRIG